MTVRLKARLDKLEPKSAEPWTISVWLYCTDDPTVTGPDGSRYTPEEADRPTADAGMMIDLRESREP